MAHQALLYAENKVFLSLYSTAIQNPQFRPPTRRFRVTYTNMLVSKNLSGSNATPNASQ